MPHAPDRAARWYVTEQHETQPEGNGVNEQPAETQGPSPALLRLAASAAASAGLHEQVQRHWTPPVEPGQLWRATWDISSVLVLIVGTDSDEHGRQDVIACPVTLDGEIEPGPDLKSWCTPTDLGMLDTGGALLWHRLRARLPLGVLDNCLADKVPITKPVGEQPAVDSDGRHELLQDVDPFADSIDLLAQLLDDLDELEHAPRLVASTATSAHGSLSVALPGSGADKIRLLTDVLGVNQADALALLRGRRPPTDTEVDLLAPHLSAGNAGAEVGFPLRLVTELEQPLWRPAVRARAHAGDELAARRSIASGVVTMAARDSAAEPNWEGRLARYLHAQP